MERRQLIEQAITKPINDINPVVAIPYATSVYSISLTKGPKWLFTGGEDGLIRKFDFFGSVEGKSLLTVSQRHQLIDSILFNGVICSYWENEVPIMKEKLNATSNAGASAKNDSSYEPLLSPVYSLAAEKNGAWLLSGLENGGITLQTVRSNEGQIQYYFKPNNDKFGNKEFSHASTVSCLQLNSNETNFLSGSWDMKILNWDLNTGKNTNSFNKSTGQISSLEYRPIIGTDFDWKAAVEPESDDDMDSLFDDDEDDYDNEEDDGKDDGDEIMKDVEKETEPVAETKEDKEKETSLSNNIDAKKDIVTLQKEALSSGRSEAMTTSDDLFMSSCINGTVNIWDARISHKSNNVLTIPVTGSTPPWCTSATWSVDGDSIFVGRRNSTIEEIDLRVPNKIKHTLKFPSASGSISCIRTLPNKNYILCGCQDNIRLYDLRLAENTKKIPFTIVPGHNSGILSDMYVDPTCRFLVSASGNRGWQGKSNDYVFIYEIL